VVVLVDGDDAIFRRYLGPGHLQEIELRGQLKQGTGVLGQQMHAPYVAGDNTNFESSR
jgi:hypothetical protein